MTQDDDSKLLRAVGKILDYSKPGLSEKHHTTDLIIKSNSRPILTIEYAAAYILYEVLAVHQEFDVRFARELINYLFHVKHITLVN